MYINLDRSTNALLYEFMSFWEGGSFLSGRIFFLCIIYGQIKFIQRYLTTGQNIVKKKVKLSKKGNKTIY